MSSTEDTPDADTLIERVAQKLQGDDGADEQPDSDADGGAEQKQPDPDDEQDVMEDLVAALAEHMNVDPAEVRAALDGLGQSADDEDDDDGEDEEDEDDVGQDAEGGDNEVNIDFGAKAEEHGLVDEDALEQKMSEFREDIVDDLGQKLSEANSEAVEEIAQKMSTGQTPSPAGGSFQDAQDFESALDEVADKEGW